MYNKILKALNKGHSVALDVYSPVYKNVTRHRIVTPTSCEYFINGGYIGTSCFTDFNYFYPTVKTPKDLVKNMKKFDGKCLKVIKAINLNTGRYL